MMKMLAVLPKRVRAFLPPTLAEAWGQALAHPEAVLAGYVVTCPHCQGMNTVFARDLGTPDMICIHGGCGEFFAVPSQVAGARSDNANSD